MAPRLQHDSKSVKVVKVLALLPKQASASDKSPGDKQSGPSWPATDASLAGLVASGNTTYPPALIPSNRSWLTDSDGELWAWLREGRPLADWLD